MRLFADCDADRFACCPYAPRPFLLSRLFWAQKRFLFLMGSKAWYYYLSKLSILRHGGLTHHNDVLLASIDSWIWCRCILFDLLKALTHPSHRLRSVGAVLKRVPSLRVHLLDILQGCSNIGKTVKTFLILWMSRAYVWLCRIFADERGQWWQDFLTIFIWV